MNVKKIIAGLTILLAFTTSVFAKAKKSDKANGKLKVVTTIFTEYDWTREILGDKASNVELTLLLGNGVDLHSYQPSIQDIAKISTADIFIYVGGESDGWVEGVLQTANNAGLKTINLLETLGDLAKAEEIVEGMEHGHDEEDEDEAENDEHVWLSLRNAQVLCRAIAQALSEIDPESAGVYEANLAAYEEQLAALDRSFEEAVDAAAFKTVLFGDRFPFRYLMDDYGITYYAAFSGCSAETEASFQTIVFLAGKVDELGLPAVLTIENPKARIAETIVASTKTKDQKILAMDSMQSVTAQGVQSGAKYLALMENNLKTLTEALN